MGANRSTGRGLTGLINGYRDKVAYVCRAQTGQEKGLFGTGGLADTTPLAQLGMNENHMLSRSVAVWKYLQGVGRTGVHAHGTSITPIPIDVDDLAIGSIGELIVVDKKSHNISPG